MLDFLHSGFGLIFFRKPMNEFIRCLAITRQNRLRPYRENGADARRNLPRQCETRACNNGTTNFIVLASGTSVPLV